MRLPYPSPRLARDGVNLTEASGAALTALRADHVIGWPWWLVTLPLSLLFTAGLIAGVAIGKKLIP